MEGAGAGRRRLQRHNVEEVSPAYGVATCVGELCEFGSEEEGCVESAMSWAHKT
jgi:hypothetical protein